MKSALAAAVGPTGGLASLHIAQSKLQSAGQICAMIYIYKYVPLVELGSKAGLTTYDTFPS